ncbi:MAG: hypothetical protein IPJ81_18340 [Chitinophagaceae bacterium]|nr:hypothetical protein [Chitinophagaceae bacterium]
MKKYKIYAIVDLAAPGGSRINGFIDTHKEFATEEEAEEWLTYNQEYPQCTIVKVFTEI